MRTVYLLQGCQECTDFLTDYKNKPIGLMNIIIVPKTKVIRDPRIKSFPFVINSLPSINGLPPQNVSLRPLRVIKTKTPTKPKAKPKPKPPVKSKAPAKPKAKPKPKPKTPVKSKLKAKPKTPVKSKPPVKVSIKKIKTNDGHMLILKKK